MTSQSPGRNSRRPRRGGSRRRFDPREERAESKAPVKKSFLQKIMGFFGGAASTPTKPARATAARNGAANTRNSAPGRERSGRERGDRDRPSHKPESIEVTTPRLYVGNLSFEASETDLFELFNDQREEGDRGAARSSSRDALGFECSGRVRESVR